MSTPTPSALQQTQQQVEDVVGVMKSNLNKVIERDAKMSELQARSETLQMGASQFQLQATQIKRKMWWQNFKMWIIMAIVFIVIILIIAATSMKGENAMDELHKDGQKGGDHKSGNNLKDGVGQ